MAVEECAETENSEPNLGSVFPRLNTPERKKEEKKKETHGTEILRRHNAAPPWELSLPPVKLGPLLCRTRVRPGILGFWDDRLVF